MRTLHMPHQALRLLTVWLCTLAMVWANLVLASPVHAQAAAIPVGEITLVIGQSALERSGSDLAQVQKGEKIAQGDVIKTTASGHVHIRFIDGALVSVRPNSVFAIQQFEYNPQQPKDSVVRFTLAKGEVRSISGRAAEEAKDRFRLNTPLVAIGVKGTDFVTSSGNQATRVTVNSGAIVMAPFDNACKADSLGVCISARARELSADMAGMVLIYQNGAPDPSLQKLVSSKDSSKLQNGDPALKDNAERTNVTGKESISPETMLPQARLVWGRWSQPPAPGDDLTLSFREAMRGNEVTVGDGYYFLFREPGAINVLDNLNHAVDFKLQSSSALYQKQDNSVQAASVQAASLNIDFGKRLFSTKLKVASEGIDTQNMQFAGTLDAKTGIFLDKGNSATGNLAGALTLNGLQAGYFFRYNLDGGKLSGATLWGR
jgi:hypothetical protein